MKALTDSMPEIKKMLRACAFHLYGWVCDDPDVENEAKQIKEGYIPDKYPESWPTGDRQIHPPNVAPFSRAVQKAIENRRAEIKKRLDDATSYPLFPRDEVQNVLNHWNIIL